LILVGIGANLPSPRFGPPRATCGAALASLAGRGVRVVRCSTWFRSAPVPPSGQPWFVNAVVEIETARPPADLMEALLAVERDFGRERTMRNAARILDLDLLDYQARVSPPGEEPVLPHPRLRERAFVLVPLKELAPMWRHPATGETVDALIAALPRDQMAEPMPPAAGLFATEWGEKAGASKI
jgi:2-amino-4-hydroxy-6-hydroxymethyldihydropteridine diphosphokinase